MLIDAIVGGVTYHITSSGVTLEEGHSGYLSPEIVVDVEEGLSASLVRSNRVTSRFLQLPLSVEKPTRSEMLERVRDLIECFLPGDITLQFIAPDATTMELHGCYMQEAPKDDAIDGQDERNIAKTVFEFICVDPYWYSITQTSVDFQSDGSVVPFFPILPLQLMPSNVLARKTVNNPGIEVYPVWTITGPGDDLTLTNLTTGASLKFSGLNMTAMDTLVIDTRPGAKTILLNGGNAWSYVVLATSSLWPLVHGDNDIFAGMNNSTLASKANLTYYARYASLVL